MSDDTHPDPLADFRGHAATALTPPHQLPPRLFDRLRALAEPDAKPAPGLPETIGPYRVIRERGRGGMGVVYEADDPALGRRVAVKVLTAGPYVDARGRERFLREARTAAAVRHDHLVPVYTADATPDGSPYLVMPLVDGPTLADRVRSTAGLPPRDAAEIVRQISDALAAMHAAGVVHRDVKPGNVLLDTADGRAKLTDFGVAKPMTADATTADGVTGTPAYLSPEQVTHPDRVDGRADVYAAGVTLYECVTGVPPFRGPPLGLLRLVTQHDPVPPARLNPTIPADLDTIALKCLEKDPARRYATAAALRDDLGRFLAGKPILARPLGPVGRAARWVRRNPLPVAVVAVSVVGAVTAGAGWWRAGVKATEAADRAADAETARGDARRKAALAEERSVIALGAVSTLVGKAQAVADTSPGTLRLKKELAESALADLRKLTESADAVPGADRTTVQAHLKLGDTLNLLGRTDDALSQWDRARAVAEQLAAADPTDHAARLDAATAHSKLGFTRNRLGQREAAVAHYKAAVETLEVVDQEGPNDPLTLHALAVALLGRGDVARDSRDGQTARADTERAAALLDRAAALDPTNRTVAHAAYYTRSRLGYTCLVPFHDYPAAVAHFRGGLKTVLAEHARRPDDPQWARNRRIALLDLSCGLQRAGQYTEAEAMAEEALPLLEAAAMGEPDNGQLQRDLGIGLCHLAWVRCGQERWADAEKLLLRANDLFEQVAVKAKAPALVAADLPANCYLLAMLSQRQGRFDEAADRMERFGRELVRFGANVFVTARLKPVVAALRLMKAGADAADQPTDVRKWLAVNRVAELTCRDQLADARAAAAALRAKHPDDPAVLTAEAMALGRSALKSADLAEREQFAIAGLDALMAAVSRDRSVLDALHLNPDFTPVRTHPAFAARLKDSTR